MCVAKTRINLLFQLERFTYWMQRYKKKRWKKKKQKIFYFNFSTTTIMKWNHNFSCFIFESSRIDGNVFYVNACEAFLWTKATSFLSVFAYFDDFQWIHKFLIASNFAREQKKIINKFAGIVRFSNNRSFLSTKAFFI